MAAEIIIGGAFGLGALYFWGWRRIRYVRAYWRYRKQAADFERALLAARADLSVANPFRAVTEQDDGLVALLGAGADVERELAACGFTVLGDVIVVGADRSIAAILRALVDRDGTTCALLSVAPDHPERARLALSSYADDEQLSSERGKQSRLAEPPFVHRAFAAADATPARLLADHRAFARLDGTAPPVGGAAGRAQVPAVGGTARSFHRFTRLDELLAELARVRGRIASWRDAQAPDVLLDADLRSVLGDAYARTGRAWARRLRGRLPEATIHRS